MASWRPGRNLHVVDYASGRVLEAAGDAEDDSDHCSYLTCAQYVGRDHILAAGTNRGGVRLLRRSGSGLLSPVASVREIPDVYDVELQGGARKHQSLLHATGSHQGEDTGQGTLESKVPRIRKLRKSQLSGIFLNF